MDSVDYPEYCLKTTLPEGSVVSQTENDATYMEWFFVVKNDKQNKFGRTCSIIFPFRLAWLDYTEKSELL